MNPFAFFFFKDAFRLADVDQRLEIAAIVVFFLFLTVVRDLVLAPRAIEQSLKRIGDESHDEKERTNDRQ